MKTRTMTRLLSLFLSVVMIFAAIPFSFSAEAATSAIKTKDEAVSWLQNQNGATYDFNGANGTQCVEFVKAYVNWLLCGNAWTDCWNRATLNGYQIWQNSLWAELGWEVYYNTADFVPQPGDIFSAGLGGNGNHTGVVISSNVSTAYIADANARDSEWSNGDPVYLHTITWKSANSDTAYGATHFIRPKFKNSDTPHTHTYDTFKWFLKSHPHYNCYLCNGCGEVVANTNEPNYYSLCPECNWPGKPSITGLKEHYDSNDTINFSWNSTEHTSHYNFWLWKKDADGEYKYYESDRELNITSISRTLSEGDYKVSVYSYNKDFRFDDGSDWIYTESDNYYFSVGHNWNSGEIITAAGCTTEGFKKYTCIDCGDTYTEAISPKGHSEVTDQGKAATCTETGLTDGSHCSVCNAIIKAQEVIPALGHNVENGFCKRCGLADYCCIESKHNYENNCDLTWTINIPSAMSITLTFSEKTETEKGFDYIYLYGADSFMEKYSGKELAGKSVTVSGDTVKIRLTSDTSNTYYGFSFTDVTASYSTLSGDYFYNLLPDGTANITGYVGSATKIEIPDILDGHKVTRVDSGVFYGRSSLESVTIPEGVTSIGICTFYGCSNLKSITVPESVTSIGDDAFTVCDNLTIYGYEDSYAQEYAEANHISFAIIKNTFTKDGFDYEILSDGTANIVGYVGTSVDVVIPDSIDGYTVTCIGDKAFNNCSSLESIMIPKSVKSIGSLAFDNCDNLSAVYISDIKAWCEINFNTFFGVISSNPLLKAHNLYLNGELVTDLVIPEDVKSISNSAFCECYCLTNVTISEGVTDIGEWAFEYCTNLKSITIPRSVTNIEPETFSGCRNVVIYGYSFSLAQGYAETYHLPFKLIEKPVTEDDFNYEIQPDGTAKITGFTGSTTKLVIPSTIKGYKVTAIGYSVFEGWDDLTDVTIPEGVTSIGGWAFAYCSGLKNISIPEGVTSIGGRTFRSCSSLVSVTIPEGVTSIGEEAFAFCKNLTSINIPSSVTNIDEVAFLNCGKLTIYGYAGSYAQKYAAEQDIPFVAIVIYTVSYNANGGSGVPANQTKNYGTDLTLSSTKPTRTGYTFNGWNTKADGTGTSYAPGDKYTANADVTLYAQWEEEVPAVTSDVFVFKIDDENIYYANGDVKFTTGSAATFDENKKTIVPLRAIAAATGVSDLKYDSATKKITFTGFDGYSIEMQTGSTICKISKGTDKFEIQIAAPYTKDGSAMLPLRDTTNLVGGYVKYDNHYIVVSKDTIADADIPGYIAAYDAK